MAPALALNCFDKGGGCEGGDRGTDWSKGGDCETIERNRGEGLLLDKTKFISNKYIKQSALGKTIISAPLELILRFSIFHRKRQWTI